MPTTLFPITATGDDGYTEKHGATATNPTTYDGAFMAASYVSVLKGNYTGTYYYDAGYLRWDTSSLPNDCLIKSVKLRFVNQAAISNADSVSLTASWSTWAVPPTNSDHSNAGLSGALNTPLGTLTATVGVQNEISLTDVADTWPGVSRTGYTYLKLALSDVSPTGVNSVALASFDQSTYATKPTLVVDWQYALADYVPTNYVDGVTAITAARLNNEEVQTDILTDTVLSLGARVTSLQAAQSASTPFEQAFEFSDNSTQSWYVRTPTTVNAKYSAGSGTSTLGVARYAFPTSINPREINNGDYFFLTNNTLSSNTVIDPDGTTKGDALTPTTTGEWLEYYPPSMGDLNGRTFRWGGYLKAPNGAQSVDLRFVAITSAGSSLGQWTGTFAVTTVWQWFEFSTPFSGLTGSDGIRIYLFNADVLHVYGFYLWEDIASVTLPYTVPAESVIKLTATAVSGNHTVILTGTV